jgi:hypothetical protein
MRWIGCGNPIFHSNLNGKQEYVNGYLDLLKDEMQDASQIMQDLMAA